MSTFGQAALHARRGGTIKLGDKTVRLLTQEEANAHALVHNPSRRTVLDDNGKPLVKNGEIVVEEFGEGRPARLGLFDVSSGEPVEFRPTPEEIAADWELVVDAAPAEAAPEPVAPEAVDAALAETAPTDLDDLHLHDNSDD